MKTLIGKMNNGSRFSTLSIRLLVYILIFSSCITILITILQLFLDYRRDVLFIEERLVQIQESHVKGVIASLWDINDRQIRNLMDGILSLPDISYVEIREKDNLLLFSIGKPPGGQTIGRDYELLYQGRSNKKVSLGTLRVVANLDGVYQRLRERLLIILGSQAIKTFLVSIFILLIFQLLVTRHLIKLAKHTKILKTTRENLPLTLDRKPTSDELDQVVESLNMLHSDVIRSHKQLSELNASLEDKVRERTLSLNREIHDRKKIEEELQKLVAVVKHSGDLINLASLEGKMTFLNEAGSRMLGINPKEIEHIHIMDVIPEHLVDLVKNEILPILKRGNTWNGELQYRNLKTGHLTDVYAKTFTISSPSSEEPQFLANVSMDITELKRTEEITKASLKEKEILLKEVHHRVKNNLQVVSSLIGLQAYTMKDKVDPATLGMFRESATRIKSMALVHERLQSSPDFAHVDFNYYIRQLANELFSNYRIHTNNIALDIQTDSVQISIDQAVPCGLIINELLSNALKHAFPKGKQGHIRISMRSNQDKMLELKVCDNGVGLPENLNLDNAETLGLKLVKTLVGQLSGEMILERIRWTCFRIIFSGK